MPSCCPKGIKSASGSSVRRSTKATNTNAPRFKAKINCVPWKLVVVLLAREAFLLGRGDQPAVAQQRRSRVMKVARKTWDMHCDPLLELSGGLLSQSSIAFLSRAPSFCCVGLDRQRIELHQRTARANGPNNTNRKRLAAAAPGRLRSAFQLVFIFPKGFLSIFVP